MMLYSTYNLLVSGVLFLLISFMATIEPDSWVIVASSISCCAVTFSLCILFLPKVYIQYKKVKVVASELFINASIKSQDMLHVYTQRSRDDEISKKVACVTFKDIPANNIRLISVAPADKETVDQQLPSFDSGPPSTHRHFNP